jgi:hypothetical protein
MSNVWVRARLAKGPRVVLTLGFLLCSWGCTLDRQGGPDPVGPSDNATSVDLNAAPDLVNADGVSQSYIRMVLRNERGEPLVNRSVLFQHDGDGLLSPSPASIFVGPVQTGLVMATDRNGVADVVYTAGTDVRCLVVWVRPYGIDTTFTEFFRNVELCQR